MSTKFWFTMMVISAFGGIICFFQINSYFADTHKINGLFTALGVIGLLGAAFCYYMSVKASKK